MSAAFDGLADAPEFETVRPPEVGLVMARGRIGGDGAPFNLGEAPSPAPRCGIDDRRGRLRPCARPRHRDARLWSRSSTPSGRAPLPRARWRRRSRAGPRAARRRGRNRPAGRSPRRASTSSPWCVGRTNDPGRGASRRLRRSGGRAQAVFRARDDGVGPARTVAELAPASPRPPPLASAARGHRHRSRRRDDPGLARSAPRRAPELSPPGCAFHTGAPIVVGAGRGGLRVHRRSARHAAPRRLRAGHGRVSRPLDHAGPAGRGPRRRRRPRPRPAPGSRAHATSRAAAAAGGFRRRAAARTAHSSRAASTSSSSPADAIVGLPRSTRVAEGAA